MFHSWIWLNWEHTVRFTQVGQIIHSSLWNIWYVMQIFEHTLVCNNWTIVTYQISEVIMETHTLECFLHCWLNKMLNKDSSYHWFQMQWCLCCITIMYMLTETIFLPQALCHQREDYSCHFPSHQEHQSVRPWATGFRGYIASQHIKTFTT